MHTYFRTSFYFCSYRWMAIQFVQDMRTAISDLILETRYRFEEVLRTYNISLPALPSKMIVSMVAASAMVAPAPALLTVPERAVEYQVPLQVQTMMSAGVSDERVFGFPEVEELKPIVLKNGRVIVTYYESTRAQTDGDPFTTASGTQVHFGTLATNCYRIGTKIRMKEIFGDMIFTVEDRMNPRYGCEIVDVWLPESPENKKFGKKYTTIEVIDPASIQY